MNKLINNTKFQLCVHLLVLTITALCPTLCLGQQTALKNEKKDFYLQVSEIESLSFYNVVSEKDLSLLITPNKSVESQGLVQSNSDSTSSNNP